MVSLTRRPSSTSVEKRVRACSTAGPMIILECSSEHSISPAGRFSPTRGFATFNETLIRVSIPRRAFKLTTRRVSMSLGIHRVGITWEDREAASLGGDIGVRARIEETGVDFGSEGAASDIGECLRAFTSFFTSTLVFLIGGSPDVRVSTRLGAGAETTRLAGFAPIRELPLGGSRALVRSLERGEGPEMA